MIPLTHGILQQKQVAAVYLSVSPTLVGRDWTAGTATFNITASGSWTLAEFGKVLWITESPTSGTGNATVTVTFATNNGEYREALLTITQGGLQATVDIYQHGLN